MTAMIDVLSALARTGKILLGLEIGIVVILLAVFVLLELRRRRSLKSAQTDGAEKQEIDEIMQIAEAPHADDAESIGDIQTVDESQLVDEPQPELLILDDVAKDEDVYPILHDESYEPTPSLDDVFGDSAEDQFDPDEDEASEDNAKITFTSKFKNTSVGNKAIYNAVKNEILSYKGMKSRVVNGGDYFRRPGKQIIKIILIGKTMRLALALDPKDYDYNIYHQKDRSGMKKYAETPMFIKVQSRLGVQRAALLISDLMKNEGLVKNKKYVSSDFARELMLLSDEAQTEQE